MKEERGERGRERVESRKRLLRDRDERRLAGRLERERLDIGRLQTGDKDGKRLGAVA